MMITLRSQWAWSADDSPRCWVHGSRPLMTSRSELIRTPRVTVNEAASAVSLLVQLIAPNDMRGRVMSIYMVAFRGGMPLGSLVSGKVADVTSAPMALAIDGVLLVLVGLYFLVRSHGVRDVEGASRAPQAPVRAAGAAASGT